MTHDELLAKISGPINKPLVDDWELVRKALRAVVELHSLGRSNECKECMGLDGINVLYPCPTIQAIEKELG